MEIISVMDMLNTMAMRGQDRELIPFSITFVTCDLTKNKGGEKITLDEAVLVGGNKSKSEARNPNHYSNFTRNIRHLHSDRIIKIHPLLVTRFNGYKVTI
ncbi:MAG: hypothetical protein QHC79_09565 [Pseudosphingobacterium sp.]|nr:hypothetical protein [Pseudosphingobacterium sp.]